MEMSGEDGSTEDFFCFQGGSLEGNGNEGIQQILGRSILKKMPILFELDF